MYDFSLRVLCFDNGLFCIHTTFDCMVICVLCAACMKNIALQSKAIHSLIILHEFWGSHRTNGRAAPWPQLDFTWQSGANKNMPTCWERLSTPLSSQKIICSEFLELDSTCHWACEATQCFSAATSHVLLRFLSHSIVQHIIQVSIPYQKRPRMGRLALMSVAPTPVRRPCARICTWTLLPIFAFGVLRVRVYRE